MIVDIAYQPRAAALDHADWSKAEVLDTPVSGQLVLRAVVCRLPSGTWQWSISSQEGQRGELISSGAETTAAAARQAAMDEITKCIEDPLD
jgi:hypothetical protein